VRILFDQGTPVPLRNLLPQHSVVTAFELGWSTLQNGELLDAAERENFDALVTTDSNLRFQQNLGNRRIAIVALLTTSWPRIQRAIPTIRTAIASATPGSYTAVEIP
jgi:hypothetical protein